MGEWAFGWIGVLGPPPSRTPTRARSRRTPHLVFLFALTSTRRISPFAVSVALPLNTPPFGRTSDTRLNRIVPGRVTCGTRESYTVHPMLTGRNYFYRIKTRTLALTYRWLQRLIQRNTCSLGVVVGVLRWVMMGRRSEACWPGVGTRGAPIKIISNVSEPSPTHFPPACPLLD